MNITQVHVRHGKFSVTVLGNSEVPVRSQSVREVQCGGVVVASWVVGVMLVDCSTCIARQRGHKLSKSP